MGKKQKVHSLTGRITTELMHKAFKAVKRNKGAAGVDKVSIQMFENNLDENLMSLMKELKSRTFEPSPVRRVYIPKGNKQELRPLGIPTVKDRIAQEVVRQLIEPIFEKLFHDNSFGFRPKRNCHQAVEEIVTLCNGGYQFVIDADIKSFFDNIPHKLIVDAVASEVADGNILGLIEKFLKSGVMEDGKYIKTPKGTPQGGVISPLLANIVLNLLDWHLHKNGYLFVRYADDFVVLAKTYAEAERALDLINSFLTDELKLKLNPDKTRLTTYSKGFDFLGFSICSQRVRMQDKSVERFKDKVRYLTTRSHNLDKEVIVKLNRVIRGTANYFDISISYCNAQFTRLDSFVRRRLRCMKYKSISKKHNMRMKNKYFCRLGLLSLGEICASC